MGESGTDEGLTTIGAFAKASRLSQKALRLYDELGLLPPARVDPVTGYRLYAPAQLEQARLVAWLRRLGMPLARIRAVVGMDAPDAAAEVRAYWARVESDVAARRELAAFLVGQLEGEGREMENNDERLAVRYAASSDTGLVRESNQDAAYASSRLLAVADGFGAGGGPASAAAVGTFRELERSALPPGELLNALDEAVVRAGRAVREAAAEEDSGTTLTAMLWTGSRLALVHIGDTRAYLLRDGDFFQITHDHTLVRTMVDEGRISAAEAASHPQRDLLIRALSGRAGVDRPDVRLHDVRTGDRYLLCSDGLTSVVGEEDVRRTVAGAAGPEAAVRELTGLALRAGAPDNVSCVVADIESAEEAGSAEQAGSAGSAGKAGSTGDAGDVAGGATRATGAA